MPDAAEEVAALRVVVREGFSRDLAGELLDGIREAVAFFEKNLPARPMAPASSFSH